MTDADLFEKHAIVKGLMDGATYEERERCLLIVHRARAEVDALAEDADPLQRYADDWLATVESYIRDPSLEWKE